MLDRISVTVALGTIMAILAKMVELINRFKVPGEEHAFFSSIGKLNFGDVVFHDHASMFLVLCFLIFFRGKMMHDDHQYFTDIEKGRYRETRRVINRFGLFFGYLSWLMWGPAIFYFPDWRLFGTFMMMAVAFSMVWCAIDLGNVPRSSPRYTDKKQYGWILSNMLFLFLLAAVGFCSAYNELLRLVCSALLLVVLFVDWMYSAPIGSVIESIDRTSSSSESSKKEDSAAIPGAQ